MSPATPRAAAPHAPLTAYYADESLRQAWVRDLFDRTAVDYERLERLFALGTGAWYRRRALKRAGLTLGMRVLDIGAGTGLVTRAAAAIVGEPSRVIGVDPCAGMVARARVPRGVQLLSGSAEAIPVVDASADFLSLGYALRHLSSLALAMREFHRVLKPGGRLCLLEVTLPEGRSARRLLKLYVRGVLPLLARVLGRAAGSGELMLYYWDTIEACVAPERILEELSAAGFTEVRRHLELGIFCEFCATKPPSRTA